MDKDDFNRIPIYYSLAYHSLSYTKDDPNHCAKEFIDYLKKIGNIVPREDSQEISTRVLKIRDEKSRRQLMQSVNLELSIESVEDLFPHLMKSKEISRQEIEQLLRMTAEKS